MLPAAGYAGRLVRRPSASCPVHMAVRARGAAGVQLPAGSARPSPRLLVSLTLPPAVAFAAIDPDVSFTSCKKGAGAATPGEPSLPLLAAQPRFRQEPRGPSPTPPRRDMARAASLRFCPLRPKHEKENGATASVETRTPNPSTLREGRCRQSQLRGEGRDAHIYTEYPAPCETAQSPSSTSGETGSRTPCKIRLLSPEVVQSRSRAPREPLKHCPGGKRSGLKRESDVLGRSRREHTRLTAPSTHFSAGVHNCPWGRSKRAGRSSLAKPTDLDRAALQLRDVHAPVRAA